MKGIRNSSLFFAVMATIGGVIVAVLLVSPSLVLARSMLDPPLFVRQNSQPQDAQDGDHEAMHATCISGDWGAMEREMDRVHPSWRSHHESMGSNGMQDAPNKDMMMGGMMGGTMGMAQVQKGR